MAQNYEQVTVNCYFPEGAITPLELNLLEEMGFQWSHFNNQYYFCSEEGLGSAYWSLNEVKEYEGDPLADHLITTMESYIYDNQEDSYDLDDFDCTWSAVFQHILRKPECTLDEIAVQGCYYSSKMRMEEFGGWVTLITKHSIESIGAYESLQILRERSRCTS